MASTTGVSNPISDVNTVSGNQPRIDRNGEAATQTFLRGGPVIIDSNGNVAEWGGSTLVIAGISLEDGNNLTTAATAQQPSFAGVLNQPLAKQYSRPKFNDGKMGFLVANDDTVFRGQVGTSVAATDKGKHYGLTKDTDGHWYIDKSKTTDGTNTVLEVVDLDAQDTARGLYFKFLSSVQQLG